MKINITNGKITGKASSYKNVPLNEIIGKTVIAVGDTTVPGAYGPEPCIYLFFSNGTKTGFVLPVDTD
jgi:hypothetical protein